MNRVTLYKRHVELCDEALKLMQRKNADYAEGHSPFANLDVIETVSRGEIRSEIGMIIRMTDKLSRMYAGLQRDLEVSDESIKDSLLDLINYAVLMACKVESRRPATPPAVSPPAAPVVDDFIEGPHDYSDDCNCWWCVQLRAEAQEAAELGEG